MIQNRYIGENSFVADSSSVGDFSIIGKNCFIGENTEIGCYVCISDNVYIGNNCIISDMVTICDNVEIGDNTFIGSGVIFVEKIYLRANDCFVPLKTRIGKKVSIHAKAVIEAGNWLDDNTVIECGEIVSFTKRQMEL